MGAKFSIKLNNTAISKLEKAYKESAVTTMEALKTDLISSETMPFDTGDMQSNQTFVAESDSTVSLVTGSPQARRLYYHPEYNFQQGKNANAGGEWFEPYIDGEKKTFVEDTFKKIFKERSGV